MIKAEEASHSLVNAKKIAVAVLACVADHDDLFPKNPSKYRAAIQPYLKKEDLGIFTSPSDNPGTLSYKMNPNLAGLPTADVAEPARTILIYLGRDKILDFRYGKRAVVALADGSARLVTLDQAGFLRWQP